MTRPDAAATATATATAPAAVIEAVAEAVKHGEAELIHDCHWAVDNLRDRLADIREDREAEERDALLGRHRG